MSAAIPQYIWLLLAIVIIIIIIVLLLRLVFSVLVVDGGAGLENTGLKLYETFTITKLALLNE
jgi:hypothetical protein